MLLCVPLVRLEVSGDRRRRARWLAYLTLTMTPGLWQEYTVPGFLDWGNTESPEDSQVLHLCSQRVEQDVQNAVDARKRNRRLAR